MTVPLAPSIPIEPFSQLLYGVLKPQSVATDAGEPRSQGMRIPLPERKQRL